MKRPTCTILISPNWTKQANKYPYELTTNLLRHGSLFGVDFVVRNHEDIETVLNSGTNAVLSIIFSGIKYYKRIKEKNILLLSWLDDVHPQSSGQTYIDKMKEKNECFVNSDILLLPYYYQFCRGVFKSFANKAVFFPWSSPESSFYCNNLKYESRKSKILLTGACTSYYPFRANLLKKCENNKLPLVELLNHPGWVKWTTGFYTRGARDKFKHDCIGINYFKHVSTFKGVVATSAEKPLDYVLYKYMESVGCGCLMYGEIVPCLLDWYGFEPMVNFVPISPDNYDILNDSNFLNSVKAKLIASNGMKLVLSKHTGKHRAEQVCKIIKDKLS